jgi:3-hydroxyisobutyrate dehydrogenase-like beta-hydroxyacid dehydrogenase
MAENVLADHPSLLVYDINTSALAHLTALGASAATSSEQVGTLCDFVFVCLPSESASRIVAEAVLGVDKPPSLYVDHSTLSLGVVEEIASRAAAVGTHFVDAPVTGLPEVRGRGELGVFMGGSDEAIELARPVIELVGNKLLHLGPTGCGNAAKLTLNFIALTYATVTMEGVLFGLKHGLAADDMAAVLMASPAGNPMIRAITGQVESRSWRSVSPPQIALRLAVKDLEIGIAAADKAGLPARTAAAALEVLRDAEANGFGDAELFSLLDHLETSVSNQANDID